MHTCYLTVYAILFIEYSAYFCRMKMLLRFILILSLLCPHICRAQDNAYGFLGIPSSARIYGLGGMNISTVEDNLNVTDQNPALLGPEMGGWLDFNYMRFLGDSNFAGVSFGRAAGAHSAWKAGIQYFGYGSVDETMPDGTVTGSFSPVDIVFSGSYAVDLASRWRIGAAVKLLYSSYDSYTACAVGADLGINYYNPDRDFSFSVVGANLGGQIKKFDNMSEGLPFDLRIGMTRGVSDLPLRWSVTAYNLTRWHKGNRHIMKHMVVGLDFTPSDKFYMSIGYNYKMRSDMSGYKRSLLSGFTAGAGLSTSRFNIGVAVAQPHNGATSLMVNFGLKIADIVR